MLNRDPIYNGFKTDKGYVYSGLKMVDKCPVYIGFKTSDMSGWHYEQKVIIGFVYTSVKIVDMSGSVYRWKINICQSNIHPVQIRIKLFDFFFVCQNKKNSHQTVKSPVTFLFIFVSNLEFWSVFELLSYKNL